ncbi:UDP-N-acetylmuramate--L-alanine ligase [Candidatus Uhrbacteria bacterium CG_4_9_14_3_um_filter_36_7]|uniref:UDP-N-acetylmuramate--L-alanine ligase n=1 Tax=Candidatus Uhrbacteria bacterium CG_4_9_14_3_um_filter_36_7 TaxID=1975033 RepID=A0A2M7XEN5_9BACT|nr:MAG: UDP-N-acetylmuramate--L-alanine ligase [Candidatus Uhrbacteria bacterium CG_4_9_14_3_um_filter_36_7]
MFDGIQHAHFVGIGGIGISAAAKFFLDQGITVSGSDVMSSPITDELEKMGVSFFSGHLGENVAAKTNLLIYSPAVPADNPERVFAKEQGIPQMSYPEVLGEISKHYSTIAVCGTNGKSTTTAMIGLILEAAGFDPTVIVGSKVPSFVQGNFRSGKGKYLVVEACEHQANFLHLHPEIVVITNIEEDHLDFYRDIDHIRDSFQQFIDRRKGKGFVVYNKDDQESQKLIIDNSISYGHQQGRYQYYDREVLNGRQWAEIRDQEQDVSLQKLELIIPGEFNLLNAFAAFTTSLSLGISIEIIQTTLANFSGIWRRCEHVGTWHGAEIISDYGHHPTAIEGTIHALREFFRDKRIIHVFQPHQHARTKLLFNDFVRVLGQADKTIITEIYEVKGRTNEKEPISSYDLVKAIKHQDPEKSIVYTKDLSHTEMALREIVQDNDVVLIQGAGDIDLLARDLT